MMASRMLREAKHGDHGILAASERASRPSTAQPRRLPAQPAYRGCGRRAVLRRRLCHLHHDPQRTDARARPVYGDDAPVHTAGFEPCLHARPGPAGRENLKPLVDSGEIATCSQSRARDRPTVPSWSDACTVGRAHAYAGPDCSGCECGGGEGTGFARQRVPIKQPQDPWCRSGLQMALVGSSHEKLTEGGDQDRRSVGQLRPTPADSRASTTSRPRHRSP